MATFDPKTPYNNLPLLPPEYDIESKVIMKKCIGARTALAELKQAGEIIPNQSVLINTIPLLEAKTSSEIENIVTTQDELFKYVSVDETHADPATKETLHYRRALSYGCEMIKQRPVSTRLAIEICSQILKTDVSIRTQPGTVLSTPFEVIYTPPVGSDVIEEKMSNWEHFLNERFDLDPLVRMAVMHYQFEAIHPFRDGNGRTGRLLNILFLIHVGVLEIPVLYLSKYILENRAGYYNSIRCVTERGEWEDWILYMLDGVEQMAHWTHRKIRAIRDLLEHTCDTVRAKAGKIYSRELVDIIFTQPYCRIQNVVDAGIAQRQTASVYLKKLVEIGVLDEQQSGRERLFIHPKFLNLLKSDENEFMRY